MQPKISIITVVRNAPAELEYTLGNLTDLDYPPHLLELIVIDGASTDSTPQVIERHSARISYSVSEPDSGLYDAMNKGIEAATGQYLWFINAGDAVYCRSALRMIFPPSADLCDDSQGDSPAVPCHADVYYGETVVVNPQGDLLGLRKKPLPRSLTWRSLRRGMVVCHQSIIVRRSIAPRYDIARYGLAADVEWVIEVLKRADGICNTNMIMSMFCTGGVSTRRRRASLRERWTIMCHHYGFFATAAAHVGFVADALRADYRPIPSNMLDR